MIDDIFEYYNPFFEQELMLAVRDASRVQDLSFEVLFEADEPIQANTIQQNEQQKTQSTNHLLNAINAIKNMITSFINRISEWFQKLTMSNKEKELYERLQQALRNDPSLANKQVTIKDFRKSKEEYIRLMNQLENAEKAGNVSEMDGLLGTIKQALGGVLNGTTVTVGMQAAMNIAQSNKDMARIINAQLQSDSKWMDMMSRAVGNKQAQKFQKDIQRYTKECTIRRTILAIRGKMFKNATDAVMDVFNSVGQIVDAAATPGLGRIGKGVGLLMNDTSRSMLARGVNNKYLNQMARTVGTIQRDRMVGKVRGKFNRAVRNVTNFRNNLQMRMGNNTNMNGLQFLGDSIPVARDYIQQGVQQGVQNVQDASTQINNTLASWGSKLFNR